MPDFAPVRPRGGRHWLRRAARRRRRALAASLAVAAAVLAAALSGAGAGADRPEAGPRKSRAAQDAEVVSAPVRIADAAAVRLLRPGDRVNVLAAFASPDGRTPPPARVVARRARVAEVPGGERPVPGEGDGAGGALLVLAVSPATAADLAGAAAAADLAVVRW